MKFSDMSTDQLQTKLDGMDKKITKCKNYTLLWLYEESIKQILTELKKRGAWKK